MGRWSTPLTCTGAATPTASRIVGVTSLTCENCARRPPASRMRAGQLTTSGLRVPPRCEATCFTQRKGALVAQAQPAE